MIAPAQRTEGFRYAIRDVVRAAEAREQDGRDVIYLNIGDPQRYGFQPPAHIVEAVARALRDGFTGYSHSAGLIDAREAIAAYATALGAPASPDDVILTAGSSEAAELLLTALVNEGDEVLIPAPGYPIYPAILHKLGARTRHYELDESREWRPSVEQVASLINKRTRALLLINPSNPAGSVTPDEVTRQLLELAAEKNLLVISDEVYRELCFGEQPAPASRLAQSIGAPLVTLESLSKTHLVPGWRTGWMRFTNSEKINRLVAATRRLADGRLCAPTPTQYAVRPALEGDRQFMRDFIDQIKERRDLALSRVAARRGLSCQKPDAAFYMMIKVEARGERDTSE